MSRKTQIIIHIVLLALQAANGLLPLFQGPDKLIGVTILAFLQGSVGVVAHSFNTDGTPQTVAFTATK